MENIIIENPLFRLTVGSDCVPKSLFCKATGEECLANSEQMPLFTVTQERPFNNEIKLAYPCKRTTYKANSLRREGDKLIVGFHIAPYEAVVKITETPQYVAFSLDSFIVHPTDYGTLRVEKPPVAEFCLLQLPVIKREHYGEWLNVSWDDKTAVNVLATAPQTLIDGEEHSSYLTMHADVRKDIRLKGPGAALIVCATEDFLDAVAAVEEDFDLPRGVESRRGPLINASIYYTWELNPKTVDEHIRYAKAGGFRLMQVYYHSIFKISDKGLWGFCGNYDYNENYPNGKEDLIAVLNKLKAAGITPGLHFLQPHIGLQSRYTTPVADHRLHLRQHFTLARELKPGDTTVYVEQDPVAAPMDEKCRVLQFGGELIHYESFSDEYPYCFTGCTRGFNNTIVQEHPLGQIGGVLDISEFTGNSVYLDQDSSLAEEISQKIADTYNCGFEFIYCDGSEGTNVPYAYHIPNAQYRVYKKLEKKPILAEGAAKAHFSWHLLSGGNAFDSFKPEIFKKMIGVHPAQEAPRMRDDFTRVNFGWWTFRGVSIQADQYEFSSSRAAAWDCPATLQADSRLFGENPRLYDILEVLRRWEEVRATNWLTAEQKEMLKNQEQEHILLINEQKEFELVPYDQIEGAACEDPLVTAFSFTRGGESYVVYWHHCENVQLQLPLKAEDITLVDELWEQPVAAEACEAGAVIPLDKRRYVKSKLPVEELIEAFRKAKVMKQ